MKRDVSRSSQSRKYFTSLQTPLNQAKQRAPTRETTTKTSIERHIQYALSLHGDQIPQRVAGGTDPVRIARDDAA